MYNIGLIAKYWNEELLLPRWLNSIKFEEFSHIFLLNDGSTDNSEKICKEYTHPTATIHHHTTEPQKSEYFKETTPESQKINKFLQIAYKTGCDWVLHLDIDEFMSIPMKQFVNFNLKETPPYYGIYFPIMDMLNTSECIIKNPDTGFHHFPCPHLKIFGKHSGYVRTISGMDLDQGVTGGTSYIMTQYPYFHMKYAFKNRRWNRYTHLNNGKQQQFPNWVHGNIDPEIMPFALETWYAEFKEPEHIW